MINIMLSVFVLQIMKNAMNIIMASDWHVMANMPNVNVIPAKVMITPKAIFLRDMSKTSLVNLVMVGNIQ